jgi:hypothetical protein
MLMEQELLKSLIQWGPGMVIAAMVLYGLYKLVNGVGMKIVECSKQQACAIEKLTQAIEDSTTRDNSEHREILIMLKVISEKFEKRENNGS